MVNCDKCKKEMRKTSTLNVSNVRYDVFVCKACGHEKRVCMGVNP